MIPRAVTELQRILAIRRDNLGDLFANHPRIARCARAIGVVDRRVVNSYNAPVLKALRPRRVHI